MLNLCRWKSNLSFKRPKLEKTVISLYYFGAEQAILKATFDSHGVNGSINISTFKFRYFYYHRVRRPCLQFPSVYTEDEFGTFPKFARFRLHVYTEDEFGTVPKFARFRLHVYTEDEFGTFPKCARFRLHVYTEDEFGTVPKFARFRLHVYTEDEFGTVPNFARFRLSTQRNRANFGMLLNLSSIPWNTIARNKFPS